MKSSYINKIRLNVEKHKVVVLLVISIVFYLLLELPYLTTIRPIMYDESWYCSTGYNFYDSKGFVNTIVGSGGNANFMLPLLIGLSFSVFGVSLFAARFVAVFCGFVTILALLGILKQMEVSFKGKVFSLALFLSLAIINTIFRFARPECCSIMFITIGTCFFVRYLKEGNVINILWLSLSTYCAIVSHPFAILLFVIYGVYLLGKGIKCRNWILIGMSFCLLLFAIIGLASITCMATIYNISDINSVSENMISRTGVCLNFSPIFIGVITYLKDLFVSKHCIYSYIIVAIIIISCFLKQSTNRILGFSVLMFMCLFPLLFPTDLMMVGLGLDYVVLLGIVLSGVVYDYVYWNVRCKKIFNGMLLLYCAMNICVTIFYNVTKREDCNDILTHDIQQLVPQNAKVFGSIRQWFFVPYTMFISDHYRLEMPEPNSFDYLIINSVDENNPQFLHYKLFKNKEQYRMIYEQSTKQYGYVRVYKNRKLFY